jgi:indole-3-glycerol phosphate synthase
MTGSIVATGTVLDRVLQRTAVDLELRRAVTDRSRLEQLADERARPIDLKQSIVQPGTRVIAEIKRASPSRGVFPVEVDPTQVAREYLDGGAAAISVLTDEPFFRGSLADLQAAAKAAHEFAIPVLRKDFTVDEFQIWEALAFGADAILLIVAALDQPLLQRLLRTATEAGLAAIVEVHVEEEMRRAAAAGASIIGINNRDLRSFAVDLAVTERLALLAPPGAAIIGESGIFTRDDVVRMEAAGADAILVGESLIVAPDRAQAVRSLLGEES